MALTQLPESVRKMLQQQSAGFYETPRQQSSSSQTMSSLQQAAQRRHGQRQEFDQEYDAGIRGLMGQIPDLEANYQKANQRLDEDYTLNAEKLDRDKTTADSRHVNTMANRGLGFSGANLVGQGRIAEDFQRDVQGLTRGRSRTMDDLTGAQNAAYRNIEARSGELQGQAAGRAVGRDEQRAWQAEQQRMQQEAVKAQQEAAQRQLEFQQQVQAQNEAASARAEQMYREQSQLFADAQGRYQVPPPAQPPPPPPPPAPVQPPRIGRLGDITLHNPPPSRKPWDYYV